MDIVNFFKQQTDKWNADKKCGFCWEFGAPLVASQINATQNETCCVKVFLTDITFSETKTYHPTTGYVTGRVHEWGFTLRALVPVALGVNNYNETKGHDVDESKWETVFYPILQCLSEDNILEFCDILGLNVNVPIWRAFLEHNYLNENYNGWRFAGTFRINK